MPSELRSMGLVTTPTVPAAISRKRTCGLRRSSVVAMRVSVSRSASEPMTAWSRPEMPPSVKSIRSDGTRTRRSVTSRT